ncbi:hypothetical protein ACFPVT_02655 [Corynebacterium choanae]|uniref:Uncharacterized protein n=1 Tax=Corynebacterium choanae TaxID=1862358 RepID=A0A3G6J4W4_9CORY|nr:hypothetical protein [Corynebacterium choanae]AZA12979.1 hypothetical protein CCHOA_02815 [Corynebacterium choanae]
MGEKFLTACAVLAVAMSVLMLGVSIAQDQSASAHTVNWPWIAGYLLAGIVLAGGALLFRRSSRQGADKVLNLLMLATGAWIVFMLLYKTFQTDSTLSWPQTLVHCGAAATLGLFTLVARSLSIRPVRKWLIVTAAAGLVWTIDTVIALTLFDLHAGFALRWCYPIGGLTMLIIAVIGFFATTTTNQYRAEAMMRRRRNRREQRKHQRQTTRRDGKFL